MWVYDPETLAFLSVNEAAILHYGYSREEFLRMTIKDIRPFDSLPDFLERVRSTSEGFNYSGDWLHQKKNRSVINVEITSHQIVFDGKRARLVMASDITERAICVRLRRAP